MEYAKQVTKKVTIFNELRESNMWLNLTDDSV